MAAELRRRRRGLQRVLAVRRRDRRRGVRQLRAPGGLRGARQARHQRRGQDRARPLRRLVPWRQSPAGRDPRRERRADLLRPRGRRLHEGRGLPGRPVAPGGRDPARVDPVHLQLPGRPAHSRQARRAGHEAAVAGRRDRPAADPDDADLLRRGAAAARGPERPGGARVLPGWPADDLPRRAGRHPGAPQARHRVRPDAGARRARDGPRHHAAGREGRARRALRRLDLRHRRRHRAAGRR